MLITHKFQILSYHIISYHIISCHTHCPPASAELLKNSMRATVEFHGVDNPMPPIKVIIADGEDNEDVVSVGRCYAMLCYAMLYYTILYYIRICYAILCNSV